MNVKNNEQYGLRNRSEDTCSTTDAVINKLLAKYNLNKVADNVGIHKFPVNQQTIRENNNAFQKEITKHPSIADMRKKGNIDDMFKRYSINYGGRERRKIPRHYVHNQNHEDFSTDEKKILYDSAFTNRYENMRNMDATLAFLKSKITDPSDRKVNYRMTNTNREFYYDKAQADKTTFCRPVCNIYNEEFVYKTLERNAKLQELLKKLILARRWEKEKEEWNNYVTELKNKHNSMIPRYTVQEYVPEERFFSESSDIYKMNQTQTSNNLINDFVYANTHEDYYLPRRCTMVDEGSGGGYLSENELHCFPTASQRRVTAVIRESKPSKRDGKPRSLYHNPPPIREVYVPRVIYVDMADTYTNRKSRHRSISEDEEGIDPDKSECTEAETQIPEYDTYKYPPPLQTSHAPGIIRVEKERRPNRRSLSASTEKMMTKSYKNDDTDDAIEPTANCSTQITPEHLNDNSKTSRNDLQDTGVQVSQTNLEDKTTKEKYDEVTMNVNRLKAQIDSNEQSSRTNQEQEKKNQEQEKRNQEQCCMRSIESKLDSLAKSINNLITKIKKKRSSTNASVKESNESKITKDREEEDDNERNGTLSVGYVETNTSTTAFQPFPRRLRRFEPTTIINDILCEELDKSNRLRRELGELLQTQTQENHSVQIMFDIPTRERATEVTNSLPRTEVSDKEVEEMSLDVGGSQMTIAVNTDPLGLLSLLTMSSDVVKQLMSYVPTVDYGWYLARLPLPQLARNHSTDFVCNICGASFKRPSQLSDHMKSHDFGNTRDCCVCRHVLDLKRRQPNLFACQYCGQRFTRAYCCQLHEQSCARALGLRHDVEPSLTLLT